MGALDAHDGGSSVVAYAPASKALIAATTVFLS